MNTPDICVLRQKEQHLTAADYAAVLRERLPGYDVAVADTPAEERRLLGRATVATGPDIDESFLEEAEKLRLFACMYAGTDHLPLEAFEARDVAVTNGAGVHGQNVAEHVIGVLLSFTNQFHRAWRQANRCEWRAYPTGELNGSTVTVVGMGAIGRAVVELIEPFGAETIGVRYTPENGGPTDDVFGFDDVHEALSRTEYLVITAPLTDETRGLIDAEALATLPPDAIVVNVGRGAVIDTSALVEVLRRNAIGGAALDVTDPEPLPREHPLWSFQNVFITPHNAGHTPEYYDRLSSLVATNVRRLDSDAALQNRIV